MQHVERSLLLDVVVWNCAIVFQLMTSSNEAELKCNAFFDLDLTLEIVDGIGGLDDAG